MFVLPFRARRQRDNIISVMAENSCCWCRSSGTRSESHKFPHIFPFIRPTRASTP